MNQGYTPVVRRRLLPAGLVAALVLSVLTIAHVVSPPPAGAACASSSGAAVGGTVEGEDGRFISAQVSIEIFTSSGQKIGMDGCPMGGGYAALDLVNEKSSCCLILPASGSTSTPYHDGTRSWDLEKSWRIDGLPTNAHTVWIETYTKKVGGQPNSDTSRYGHTIRRPVPVGSVAVDIVQPLRCGATGNGITGSTGEISGSVYDNGRRVTASRVSVFATGSDDGNGGSILSFNVSGSHPSGGYDIDALAPGTYSIFVTASGITRRFDNVNVSDCGTTVHPVAVRGSVPRVIGDPVSGDWDGDGDDEPGVWDDGTWYLRSDAGSVASTLPTFSYGVSAGDIPVVGDWDGDGDDEPAIFRRGTWHFRSDAGPSGRTVAQVRYGVSPGDIPVVGDWDGDGDDEPAIFRRGTWHFRSDAGPSGRTVAQVRYGVSAGDIPVAGDWDGDGADEPAIYRKGTWHYRSTASTSGRTMATVRYGVSAGDRPLGGQWDRDLADEPAIYRAGEFHLRGSAFGTQSTIFRYRFPDA
ncbi:hypothetical protein [Actinospongicola halichondriae]|uniref:hypothetical protein n=1 Tax=Actinospongicola halichondriae TaxID=3236844 RepID=UPI003D4BCEB2